MESIHIHLNSSNAIKYYNDTYYSFVEFTFPVIEIPSDYTIHLSVSHVSIPYSFYNVNERNNILKYSILSTIYTVYIPSGNYTTSNLLSTLKNLLPNTFTITYSGITNKFTFSNSSQDFTFIYDPNNIQSTCFYLLGFSLKYQNSVNKILISDTMVNLSPTRCLCISSSFHTQNISSISPLSNYTICSIPISVNPFTNIT
jgi:hypothetical protein